MGKNTLFPSLLSVVSITLLFFSELFYVNTSHGPISVFLLLSPPIFLLWFALKKKVVLSGVSLISYCFLILLGSYTAAGVVMYARPTLAIQFLTLIIAPVLFVNIGFFTDKKTLALTILWLLFIAFIFSISQFMYFGPGFSGPFSIIEKTANIVTESQRDFMIENIYGRSSGIFNSPNILGYFSGMAFWMLLYFNKELSRSQIYVAVVCSISCLILSSSRGSLFAFILSVAAFLSVRPKQLKLRFDLKLLVAFIFVLTISIILYIFYIANASDQQMDRFGELLRLIGGDVGASANFSARTYAWASISDKISQMPFGTILPPQLIINESPDNQFIYYLAQGGYLLAIFSILFYVLLFIVTIRANYTIRPYFIAAILFSAVNSVSITIMNNFCFSMFWLFLGMSSHRGFKREGAVAQL